ncbi:MAG: DUF971 domain-containing protein [Notoacmeibacter sp.]|nr:DUF971 domain-containing protein [Notoacmeibacter sp.]
MDGPTEIRVTKDRKIMKVRFGDEPEEFPAELLRVLSPSAEVQGHAPDQRKTVPGKRDVQILSVEPVGNYAVKITFDDMHSTGIYTWAFFRELAETKDQRWQAYLDELDAKGLSREPRR